MEKRSRRKFSAEFKAKVVIESLREHETIDLQSGIYFYLISDKEQNIMGRGKLVVE